MSATAPLLEIDGVSKRFGPVQALDRVDFARQAQARWSAWSATTAPASRPW